MGSLTGILGQSRTLLHETVQLPELGQTDRFEPQGAVFVFFDIVQSDDFLDLISQRLDVLRSACQVQDDEGKGIGGSVDGGKRHCS